MDDNDDEEESTVYVPMPPPAATIRDAIYNDFEEPPIVYKWVNDHMDIHVDDMLTADLGDTIVHIYIRYEEKKPE